VTTLALILQVARTHRLFGDRFWRLRLERQRAGHAHMLGGRAGAAPALPGAGPTTVAFMPHAPGSCRELLPQVLPSEVCCPVGFLFAGLAAVGRADIRAFLEPLLRGEAAAGWEGRRCFASADPWSRPPRHRPVQRRTILIDPLTRRSKGPPKSPSTWARTVAVRGAPASHVDRITADFREVLRLGARSTRWQAITPAFAASVRCSTFSLQRKPVIVILSVTIRLRP